MPTKCLAAFKNTYMYNSATPDDKAMVCRMLDQAFSKMPPMHRAPSAGAFVCNPARRPIRIRKRFERLRFVPPFKQLSNSGVRLQEPSDLF